MIKNPKYNFGLLETPDSSDVARSAPTSITSERESGEAGISTDSSSSTTRPPSASIFQARREAGSTSSLPYPSRGSSSVTPRVNQRTPGTGGSSIRSRTPGSRRTPYTSSGTPGGDSSSVVAALVEGRGLAKGEIGLASIDLKQPVLVLSQFSDSQTYVKTMTKLQILQPIEIIMPNTACENGNMTPLFKLISDQYQNTNIATVQRKYYNETKGLQYIKQLCVPEFNTVVMEVASKYYCLSAVAALLKYVEFIQNMVYAPASLQVVFRGSEQTTMIDASTAINLELLLNARDPKSVHSLFGILNYCKTHGGVRLLRSNILQPPCNEETISMRLDAVAELTENEEMFFNLQTTLGRCLDIDHLLSLCVQIPKQESVRTAEAKITNIIALKHTLELIEPLKLAIQESQNTLLKAYYNTLDDERFDIIMAKIRTVIHDDTRYQKGALNMRTQKCFAVKTNINDLLDVARRTYTEIVDDIAELTTQLSQKHGLPLKTSYNTTRGFHLSLYCGGKDPYTASMLPAEFIKACKFRNTLSFTTTDLIKMNDRIKESLQEIYLMTNIVVTELLKDIRDQIGCLHKLTDCVAMLDMLVAFAHNCTLSDYVRPELTDTIAIKQGRHPILDKIGITAPIPNNTYCSEECTFIIITGPNMSGKSTYLRQIALLQVMAQIGSFIPAEYASFRVADQIFSRIGSDDDMETNSSTFMLEMKEINYIVQNASSKSLIIIDELGRGTSADEGVGICHSICEYLLNLKAYTFFATHFFELTKLDQLYANAENYHLEIQRMVSEDGSYSKVSYTHVLSKGKTQEKHYGIQLAEVSALPASVIKDAKEIASFLAEQQKNQAEDQASKKQRAVFKLGTRLVQAAKNSRLDSVSLRGYLSTLREQFMQEIKDTIPTRPSSQEE